MSDGDALHLDRMWVTQVSVFVKSDQTGTSLVVQWLRLCLPVQGVQVRSLVRKLRSHMPLSEKKNNKTHETEAIL